MRVTCLTTNRSPALYVVNGLVAKSNSSWEPNSSTTMPGRRSSPGILRIRHLFPRHEAREHAKKTAMPPRADSLKRYREKRDFGTSPEPEGKSRRRRRKGDEASPEE